MRFTFQEIKKDLADNWAEFNEQNADDKIIEYADGYCPIYTNEVIKEWAEMPSEFNDSWQDQLGGDWNAYDRGIVSLMSIDLFTYYCDTTTRAYDELKEEKEQEEND